MEFISFFYDDWDNNQRGLSSQWSEHGVDISIVYIWREGKSE
jgi:hypothetical protein